MSTWAEVCAIPWLKDIPCKVETNRFGKIMMSPASSWHSGFQHKIGMHLERLMPRGHIMVECPIETTDGTRVADVAWMSRERWLPHKRAVSLPIAPEICVEILSPSNTREEMISKMQLYYAAGAREVWLCDGDGNMEFFSYDQIGPVDKPPMCVDFPTQVELD